MLILTFSGYYYETHTSRTLRKSLILQVLACIRETMRSKSGRPFATFVKSASIVGWCMRSWIASRLKRKIRTTWFLYDIIEEVYRALIASISLRGMHSQIRNKRFPKHSINTNQMDYKTKVPKGVIHLLSIFSREPSSVPSLFIRTYNILFNDFHVLDWRLLPLYVLMSAHQELILDLFS